MKRYIAIIASVAMLATTAFGKLRAAAPTGVDKTAAYVSPANTGTQATWALQYGTDHKTPTGMLTSTTPGAPVVLTVGPRGGGMRGGFSGRGNMGPGFGARSFGGRSFDRDRAFHRDFDRDRFLRRDFDRDRFFHRDFDRDHFFPRHRFFDRDDFFFGFYPFAPYYYSYPYYYYPYGYYDYGYPGYYYPYPYFYFSW